MTPCDVLKAARDLLERPPSAAVGGWQRAVALLARQALEQAIEDFWAMDPSTAGLREATRKTQLTCLPAYLQPRLAREISYLWAALSNACHYHPYDLAPTGVELAQWIEAVAALLMAIKGQTPPAPSPVLRPR
jgi:hypothetical protein